DRLRGQGVAILVSTHALAEVEPHVDRVALVHRGRLLAVGDMATLRRRVALPLKVRLRVTRCTTSRVLAQLSGYAETLSRDEQRLALAVAPGEQRRLIQDLAELGDLVEEVEIEGPGLDALYRHLTADSLTGEPPR